MRAPAMQRKPILMPPEMISKVDRIAKGRDVSFAEVVRDAVNAYDDELTHEEQALLEAVARQLIDQTNETISRIDETIKRMDHNHARIKQIHAELEQL